MSDINVSEIIKKEDYFAVQEDLVNIATQYLNSGENRQAFIEAQEKQDETRLISSRPDEDIVPPEPVTHQEASVDNRKIIDFNRITTKERTGCTKQQVNAEFGKPTADGTINETEAFKDAVSRAARKPESRWASGITQERRGSYYKADGTEVRYKQLFETTNWGRQLSPDISNSFENLEFIRKMITKNIHDKFGGWNRITTLAISSYQLILNGVMYIPIVEQQYISRLPIDVADYMGNGCIAMLFDYSVLKHMSNLVDFVCDDTNVYVSTIGTDLGVGARIGVSTLFRVCKSLQTMTLGSETVTRDSLNKPESAGIKEKVRREKISVSLLNGMKHDICGGSQGIQDFFFKSVRDYATNRGDKGFLKYAFGTTVRAGAAAIAGVTNLGVHLVTGVGKTVLSALRDGMKPISSSEATGQGGE